jgi:intracellular sulfur oxidation DsrE/DsrF family protein
MTNRRDFIGASTSVAAAGASLATASPSFPSTELDAVANALARPARHRQVFAVARVADGVVASYIGHALEAYESTLGEGAGALHAAAVFYGRGVVLGLNDRAWKTYRLADAARRRAETISSSASDANPFSAALSALVARGTTLLVCDNALADWSAYLAAALGVERSPADIHADLRANLLAGAHLVPAGVAALNAAQEAHFTFFQASI